MGSERPSPITTLLWLAAIFLLSAIVTGTMFLLMVPTQAQGNTFRIAMSLVIAAEFVFFAYLADTSISGRNPTTSHTTRIQVIGLVGIWLIISIILSVWVLAPENNQTTLLLVIEILITVLFFAFAVGLIILNINTEKVDQIVNIRNRRWDELTATVEEGLNLSAGLAKRFPDISVKAGILQKKLDILRTSCKSMHVLIDADSSAEQAFETAQKRMQTMVSGLSEPLTTMNLNVSDIVSHAADEVDAILAVVQRTSQSQFR